MRRNGSIGMVLILVLTLCISLILWSGSFAAAAERESVLQKIQRTGVIRVGWALWRPWMVVDIKTKKLTGIGPDVIEELAKALGNVKIEWVGDSWGTLVAGLQSGKFDITYPLAITLTRALACTFSDYTLKEANYFLIKKTNAARFKSFDDIDQPGVTVATTLGASTDLMVTRVLKKATIVRYKVSPEITMAVKIGRADVQTAPAGTATDILREHKDMEIVKHSFFLSKNCFAIRQGDQIFVNWINLFIAEMKETGVMDRILKKYGLKSEMFFD